jgi:hypothetical protein
MQPQTDPGPPWRTFNPLGKTRLADPSGEHTVAAKWNTQHNLLFLDLHSRKTGWSVAVLDAQLQPVTQKYGRTKDEAWRQVAAELGIRP